MIESCILSVFPQQQKFNIIKQINMHKNADIHLNLIGIVLAYWTAENCVHLKHAKVLNIVLLPVSSYCILLSVKNRTWQGRKDRQW